MPLNDDTTSLLENLAAAGVQPFHQGTPENGRAAMDQLMGLGVSEAEIASVEDYFLPETQVKLRVTQPKTDAKAIIVYYHGGGWVCGSAENYDSLARELAAKSSCIVIAVDYRLSPEYPYPIPLNDSWDALRWIADNRSTLNANDLPLIVAGDSAGGNLATVVAQRALKSGPAIALQILIYPVTDFKPDNASYTNPENQVLLTANDMFWFWDHYTGASEDRLQAELSPIYGDKLDQLPPTLIIAAEYDVLHDEDEAYARKLSEAGVTVEYLEAKGEIHGFIGLLGVLSSSLWGVDRIVAFIDNHLQEASV